MKRKWNTAGIAVMASGLLMISACSDSEETVELGDER